MILLVWRVPESLPFIATNARTRIGSTSSDSVAPEFPSAHHLGICPWIWPSHRCALGIGTVPKRPWLQPRYQLTESWPGSTRLQTSSNDEHTRSLTSTAPEPRDPVSWLGAPRDSHGARRSYSRFDGSPLRRLAGR